MSLSSASDLSLLATWCKVALLQLSLNACYRSPLKTLDIFGVKL